MKNKYLVSSVAVALGFALTVAVLMLVARTSRPVHAAPICARYVVSGGSNSTNCASSVTPCKTIQYALQQAASGDRICVADRSDLSGPTTYYGTVVVTKSVTLDGAWETRSVGDPFTAAHCPSQNVVIDGQGLQRAINITGNIRPTIQCFVFTGGDADGLGGDPDEGFENHAGGGIYSRDAAPIIVNNIITGNYGCNLCSGYGVGGGVYMLNAPATAVISDNLIANNLGAATILGWGGGIALRNSNAQVRLNTVQNNQGGTVGNGGGIYVIDGSPTIADNQIMTNTSGTGVMGNGGGIFVRSSMPVTIEHNLIEGNSALKGTADPALFSRGGGLYYEGPTASIRDNEIYGNVAALYDERGLGGGMYLRDLSAAAVVIGNVVANDNRASYVANGNGGGIYLDACYATVAGNQVFNNIASSETPGYGGGIYVNGGGGLLQGNAITGNLAVLGAVSGTGWGGGMAISNSVALVQDNRIAGNAADSAPDATGVGGGVYVYSGAPRVVGNDILSNTTGGGGSGFGGGLYLQESRPWVDGNIILDNRSIGTSASIGGGVRVASCPAFTLTNNIIARNAVNVTGSGVAIVLSTGRIDNNTIVANLTGDGVGVHVSTNSTVGMYNNIIVSHTVGVTNATPANSTVSADHTLFEGTGLNYSAGVSSVNEISGPAALFPNYHLRSMSGAIDHATPLAWVTSDVDGEARPWGAASDVGADEKTSVCDRYVLNVDTTDAGRDCSDPTHPCRTVTYALGQALNGDRICIADHPLQPGPSVYTGTHTVNKSVTLDGAWQAQCVDPSDLTCSFWAVPCDPANVALDAQGAGPVVNINPLSGWITPTVRCLTLTGGHANKGAGIYMNNARATIASNIITNNVADLYGGGINVESASAIITANAVLSNSASYGGGGIEMTDATVVLGNNHIAENQASYGGGLELDRASVTATANLIIHNQSSSAWMISGSGGYRLLAVNNAVVDNDGAAFRIYNYRADLGHNTIVSNTGNAVEGYYTATLTLTNNLIAFNTGNGVITNTGSTVSASYNLFWHNSSDPITGTHAVLESPALLADGYHLGSGSAAINAGVDAGVTTDIDGDPRPIGPLPDIGVDEYYFRVYLPLVLRNW